MAEPKPPMTDGRLRLLLGFGMGFCILFVLGILALVIALGKVEERTSYGLLGIITPLTTLAGAFVGWAFGKQSDGKADGQQ